MLSFKQVDRIVEQKNSGAEKLKKKVWLVGSIVALIVLGIYLLVFFKPPLEVGAIFTDGDKKSVVVSVGNKGLQHVKILDVKVNNNNKPDETKIQVSNNLLGFTISHDFDSPEAAEFNFTDPEEVVINTGTSPTDNYKKMDNGTATVDDEIYGISVLYPTTIFKVDITYSYLGIPFNETVVLN